MFANRLFEKREVNTSYSDAEKLFLKFHNFDTGLSGDAIRETTYFTCMKIVTEAIAKVPCYLLQGLNDGDTRASNHYIYEKICLRPNEYMSAIDFWKAMELNRQHKGRGCAYIERDSKGKVLNFWPVEFKRLIIDDKGLLNSDLKNKILVEFKVPGSNKTETCLYKDILDLKNFSIDGINSNANKEMIRDTVNTNIKSQKYLNALFDNGLTSKMVVQLTSDIKEEKELKKIQAKFDRLYSSTGRAFTIPAGYNVQALNLSLSDAQFEQIRRMSISQIAASFGIKMFQLNDLKDTNNNSLEQQQLSFLIDTLLILFESIEQELDWKVLTPVERINGYKFRFNTNVMLRTNAESQANILSKYVAGGIYTPNEARLMLQKQKLAGADDLIVNAGVLKIKDIGKGVKE
ncbi:phage portal protein [uncultured Clostridium sp.]|jgi:HK97 family phage portal protein|uniref:phage portal protein n=1 Tax=uncultured Clostridium sp. TaxID=59620 RepID=UPI00260447F1|nr:phage portal protein [uncultured Clostridium sp.]